MGWDLNPGGRGCDRDKDANGDGMQTKTRMGTGEGMEVGMGEECGWDGDRDWVGMKWE